MRGRPAAFAWLVVVLLAPAGAQAGTASLAVSGQSAALTYTAAPGELNALTVRGTATAWTLNDAGAPLTPGAGCAVSAPGQVSCALPPDVQPRGGDGIDARIDAGDGDDRVDFQAQPPKSPTDDSWHLEVAGGAGNDTLVGTSTQLFLDLDGGAGNDTLQGGAGDEFLTGGPGADVLHGGAGDDDLWGDDSGGDSGAVADDVIDGGPGRDEVDYDTNASVTVDLARGTSEGRAGEHDRLTGIEDVQAGSGPRNVLRGDGGPNTLSGGFRDKNGQADVIDGRGGDDILIGLGDRNELTGGAGDDRLAGELERARLRCGGGSSDLLEPFDLPVPVLSVPAGCEQVGVTGLVSADAAPLRARRGRVRIRLHRLGLLSLRATVSVRARHGGALLARGRFKLSNPKTRTVSVALTPAGAVARGTVPVVVSVNDPAGGPLATARFRSTLRSAG